VAVHDLEIRKSAKAIHTDPAAKSVSTKREFLLRTSSFHKLLLQLCNVQANFNSLNAWEELIDLHAELMVKEHDLNELLIKEGKKTGASESFRAFKLGELPKITQNDLLKHLGIEDHHPHDGVQPMEVINEKSHLDKITPLTTVY